MKQNPIQTINRFTENETVNYNGWEGAENGEGLPNEKNIYFMGNFGGGTLTVKAKFTNDAAEDYEMHATDAPGTFVLIGTPANGYDFILTGATNPSLEVGIAGGKF